MFKLKFQNGLVKLVDKLKGPGWSQMYGFCEFFQNLNRFWTLLCAKMYQQKLNLRSKCETLLRIYTELSYVFLGFSKKSSYISSKIEIK